MSDAETVPAPTVGTRRGRSAALTGIGQVFVLIGASAIGVIVAARLAPGARLDAYFTANQISVAALYVGQALRTSVPALQVGGVVRAEILTRAALVMTVVAAATLLLVAVIGPLLLPEAARVSFSADLAILLPGAVLQVLAGYAAGRLAIVGRFAGVALAYALGTGLNAALLVGFVDSGGAGVLAPAAVAGWVTSAVIIGWLLWRSEREAVAATVRTEHLPIEQAVGPPVALVPEPPVPPHAAPPVGTPTVGVFGASGRIVLSVLPVLAAQLVVVAAVTAAASVRAGGATVMSFAFLAINAVGAVAVAPIPIVLASDLGSTWDRRSETLTPLIHSIVRLSVAVTVPLVLVLVLVGRPVSDLKLGGLSPDDVRQLFELVAVFLPSLPLTAAGMVGVVAVVTLDRLSSLARWLGLAALGMVITIGVIAATGASLLVLGIGAGFWSAVLGCVPLAIVLGASAPAAVLGVLRETVRVAAPTIAVTAVGVFIGAGAVAGVVLAVAGGLVHLLWMRLAFRPELEALSAAVLRRG